MNVVFKMSAVIVVCLFMLMGLYEGTMAQSYPRFEGKEAVLKEFPFTSADDVIGHDKVVFDAEEKSSDGGSLRVNASENITVPLFETEDIDIEDAVLIYSAQLKVDDLEGKAFLEMLCSFPDSEDLVVRPSDSPFTGNRDWEIQQLPFFLKAGENPSRVKLNLVVEGKGAVWIDDIKLSKASM